MIDLRKNTVLYLNQTNIGSVSAGTTNASLGQVVFANSNGLSFGLSGSTITGSFSGGGGAADGINRISAGSQLAGLTQTVKFDNANGITFGMSNSSVITASHNGLTTQNNQIVSAGNGSFSFETLVFADSNGVSFSTGSQGVFATVKTDYLTTGAQSNQVVNSLNGSTGQISLNVGSSLSASSNGSSITFGLASNITTALQSAGNYLTTAMQSNAVTLSNIRISGGTTSNLLSAITFNNANGVSFGLDAGTMTASHNGITTARASNDGVGLNTAQTNVTWTVNSAGLSLDGRNYAGTVTGATNASVTLNSNGFSISVAPPSAGVIATQVYDVGSAGSTGTITRYAPEDHRHAGIYAIGVTNVGNTVGNTGTKHGQFYFAGTNNVTLSQATATNGQHNIIIIGPDLTQLAGTGTTFNGANISGSITQNSNGINLSLSAADPGGGAAATVSTYIPYYPASTGAQTMGAQGVTSASAWFFPISIQDNLHFNIIEQLMTASVVSSSVSFNHTVSHRFGLYSNNAGTLSLISSSSYSVGLTGSSVSHTINCPASYGTAGGYTYSTFAATTTAQAQSLFGTAGNRVMSFGFNNSMSLSAGLYWLGIHARQSSSGANGGMAFALAGNVMAAPVNAGGLGSSTAAYTGTNNTLYKIPWGVATSTGSAGYGGSALPSAVNVTAMGMTATQMPMMTLISR